MICDSTMIAAIDEALASARPRDARSLNGLYDQPAFAGKWECIALLAVAVEEDVPCQVKKLRGCHAVDEELQQIAEDLSAKRQLPAAAGKFVVNVVATALNVQPVPGRFLVAVSPPLAVAHRVARPHVKKIWKHNAARSMQIAVLVIACFLWLASLPLTEQPPDNDSTESSRSKSGTTQQSLIVATKMPRTRSNRKDEGTAESEASIPIDIQTTPASTRIVNRIQGSDTRDVKRVVDPAVRRATDTHRIAASTRDSPASLSPTSNYLFDKSTPKELKPVERATTHTRRVRAPSRWPPSISAESIRQVVEFHLPEHGNDPLHAEVVRSALSPGDVVEVRFRARTITLQILRPITRNTSRASADVWLARPVN